MGNGIYRYKIFRYMQTLAYGGFAIGLALQVFPSIKRMFNRLDRITVEV